MRSLKYKGFTAKIMEAERLVGDHVFGLPPGTALPVYYVDEFLHPKEEWITGPGSFVVPVRPNKGLWFDWRGNSEINTAVVPTIRGCNPITGLKTEGFFLERYADKCPKHKCSFLADRFCPECDFKWPPRNYQSMSPLWWDGWFNSEDGTVRQFFFTEEMMRDVASSLIGKKNTVPAFGFAFFTPKEMRPEARTISRGMNGSALLESSFSLDSSYSGYSDSNSVIYGNPNSELKTSYEASSGILPNPDRALKIGKGFSKSSIKKKIRIDRFKSKKVEVSIGAGAKIRQDLNKDTYPLDSWKEKPDAVMTLYFVFQDEFEQIKAKGMRDLSGTKEGMLKNTPVG